MNSPHYDCHKCFRIAQRCGDVAFLDRMILCPECGNKRCAKALDHDLACTFSNEPSQHMGGYDSTEIEK